MITDIFKTNENKKFKELQKQGMLPSDALRKIESERREETIKKKDDTSSLVYIGFGAIGTILLYIYLRKLTSKSSHRQLSQLTIDTIQGIDTVALNECRNKGLI